MKKIFLLLPILVAVIAISCKKETLDNPDRQTCFYFEAIQAGSTVGMKQYLKEGLTLPEVSLEYSTDNVNWQPLVIDQTVITLANAGDRAYIRAQSTNNTFSIGYSEGFLSSNSFLATGDVRVGGNIMYLLDKNGQIEVMDDSLNRLAFCGLFREMKALSDASQLVLPVRRPSVACYNSMFLSCRFLQNAPRIEAQEMSDYCCYCMFSCCTSLEQAPELPATKLDSYCYCDMFDSCVALTGAPALPATSLAEGCYYLMFEYCLALEEAPVLPATLLVDYCYASMFDNCKSLRTIEVSFVEWAEGIASTYEWVRYVSSAGTFRCPSRLDVSSKNISHVPAGWKIEYNL